jgi:hypothetical protein
MGLLNPGFNPGSSIRDFPREEPTGLANSKTELTTPSASNEETAQKISQEAL